MARKRGTKWQADIRQPSGERLRPAFDTQNEAIAWEAAARLALEQGKPLPPVKASVAGGTKSLALLGPLFDHVKRTEWASNRDMGGAVRNGQGVVDHFGRNTLVASITSADIASYRADLADKGLAPATVNRKCSALSKMLRVAKDAGAIGAVPRIKWATEVQTRFRYLDEAEEKLLLAYWKGTDDEDMLDLSILLLDTGARSFSEMVPAHWNHYSPGITSLTFWSTKSNKPRTVPLTKRAQAVIARRKLTKANHAGPFTMVNKDNLRGRWDRMRHTLGFADVTPHTLRHTCCTRLVLGGADIKRVMEWMGHSAVVTTMRYMQIRPSSLDELAGMLDDRIAA